MTLQEQIANRCVHFTGIQNECCKIGIKYHDIRGEEKPYRFPCLNKSNNCKSVQMPTPEEIKKEFLEIQNLVKQHLTTQ